MTFVSVGMLCCWHQCGVGQRVAASISAPGMDGRAWEVAVHGALFPSSMFLQQNADRNLAAGKLTFFVCVCLGLLVCFPTGQEIGQAVRGEHEVPVLPQCEFLSEYELAESYPMCLRKSEPKGCAGYLPRSDNRETWSPVPHPADGWISLFFWTSLCLVYWVLQLGRVWFFLPVRAVPWPCWQSSSGASTAAHKAGSCSAEHHFTQQLPADRVLSAWVIRQLQPQTTCCQPAGVNEAQSSAGDAVEKSLWNGVPLLWNDCLQESASSGQMC